MMLISHNSQNIAKPACWSGFTSAYTRSYLTEIDSSVCCVALTYRLLMLLPTARETFGPHNDAESH